MSSPPETLKILLVEDEDDDRVFINRAFSRSRYDAQIVEASTLKDARELATDPQYQFDVAVVDQLLPDGNGLDFCRFLDAQEIGLPVVILTGHGDAEAAQDAFDLHVANYILKQHGKAFMQTLPVMVHKAYLDGLTAASVAAANQRLTPGESGAVATAAPLDGVSPNGELLQALNRDFVTGLPGRPLVVREIEDLANSSQGSVTVLVLNLNGFSELNTVMGRESADAVLCQVADVLESFRDQVQIIGRLDADRFAIIHGPNFTASETTTLAKEMLQSLAVTLHIDGSEVPISGRIGIIRWQGGNPDTAALLHRADIAAGHAERAANGGIAFYNPDMDQSIRSHRQIVNGLRRAVAGGELSLYYQPQFASANGRLVGAEALLRWTKGFDGQAVPPSDFVPVAEESGLILDLGRWVLHTVCQHIHSWAQGGLDAPVIAINLSPRQFLDPELADWVEETIQEYDVKPTQIQFEVTENAVMHDSQKIQRTLGRLSKLGFHLSIDDFGTGYSSLSYLQQFPFDHIKIDKSFILPIAPERDAGVIARTVIDLAHGLGKSVVAEGVETPYQASILTEWGCDVLQGYELARPEPESAFANRLASG